MATLILRRPRSQKASLTLSSDPDESQHVAMTGHVEQWGPVKHKKDKKSVPFTTPVQSRDHAGSALRGDSRGARGGRGGRGGPGRGGAARGAFTRGGHQETNGRTPKHGPSKNGDVSALKAVDEAPAADSAATDVHGAKPVEEAPATESVDEPTSTPAAWGALTGTNGVTALVRCRAVDVA